ncbi:right-handed parallel beta-helix repeat-containing protein, partial [Endozoicomonas ascidiicola]|uniref:right-handed parallel beta-helix repeat-containing protein n=1 Tax=Endozoicomonas ascidiicola TaxID=1698521 RepID=UPI0012FE51D6
GIRNTGTGEVDARGVWWGAVDGPSGDGSGSGDQVTNAGSGSIVTTDFLQGHLETGTRFSYLNAGPNTSEGQLTAPVIEAGIATAEWGTSATQRALYELERVELQYPELDSSRRYRLMLTYYNPDNTDATGGTVQKLSTADGVEIHGNVRVSRSTPTPYLVSLPQEAYRNGSLDLTFERQNGYRAAVSQVLLLEEKVNDDSNAPVVSISAPLAEAHISGSHVRVEGQVSDTEGNGVELMELGIDGGTGIVWRPVSQLNGDGSWSYHWKLGSVDKTYQLFTRTRDGVGNSHESTDSYIVHINNVKPEPAQGLVAIDTPQDSGGSISLSWQLSSDDGGGFNDIAHYELQRRLAGSRDYQKVKEVTGGLSDTVDVTAETGTSYDYQIVVVDKAGNRSSADNYNSIAAIDNTQNDESAPEDVISLVAQAGNGTVALRWERSPDTAGDLIDQLLDISSDGGVTWGAPVSLGKLSTNYVFNDAVNGTSYRFRIRVKDSASPANISSGAISESVVPSASAYTSVSGTLSQDTVWPAGTYRVTGDLSVPKGVTLTVQAGAVLKFNSNVSLNVNGRIDVLGQAASPAVFTAFTDDSFGGDSNNDGPSEGAPGYWKQIYINGGEANIDYAIIRFGGRGNNQNLYSLRSNLKLTNSVVEHSAQRGVYVYSGASDISKSTIRNNASNGLHIYRRTSDAATTQKVLDNTIEANAHGIYVQYNNAWIENNRIQNNRNYGIYFNDASYISTQTVLKKNQLTGNQVPLRIPFSVVPSDEQGNRFGGNASDHVVLLGSTMGRNITLGDSGVKTFYQYGAVTVAAGAALKLVPGTVWKVSSNAQLSIQGALASVGTKEEPIFFTSYRDDSVGEDVNGNGAEIGRPGDWYRISFADSTLDFLTRLEHTRVRYAGYYSSNNSYSYAAVYLDRANITIR